MDRHNPIWENATWDTEDYPKERVRSQRSDKILAGVAESGARVTARNTDFKRDDRREVFERLGTHNVSWYMEWEPTDRIKGLEVVVETEMKSGSKRRVEIFLPDGLPSEGYQRPLEAKVKEGEDEARILSPDLGDEFDNVQREILYYLGDNIIWSEPEEA